MKKVFAVIGTGRQGVAIAYDLIVNGNAEKIFIVDSDETNLNKAVNHLEFLTEFHNLKPVCAYADSNEIVTVLNESDVVVSALPYVYNLMLTSKTIDAGASFIDLGGHTETVIKQMELNTNALQKGVALIPDCGMDPGLNISMIMYVMDKFEKVNSVKLYGAGLAQYPRPPWNYELSFNINGLTNEYYGDAVFIREGKVCDVPTLTEIEQLEFDENIGLLEAAVTSGGLSTLPYELESRLTTLENKTLRYPGHWGKFIAFKELGLFNDEKVMVNGCEVVPRDFYHKLLEPQIKVEKNRDIGIIKLIAEVIENGKEKTLSLCLSDFYSKELKLTSMQKLTGWHASIMAIAAAEGKITPGAHSVSLALSGKYILDEFAKRGIKVKEKFCKPCN